MRYRICARAICGANIISVLAPQVHVFTSSVVTWETPRPLILSLPENLANRSRWTLMGMRIQERPGQATEVARREYLYRVAVVAVTSLSSAVNARLVVRKAEARKLYPDYLSIS